MLLNPGGGGGLVLDYLLSKIKCFFMDFFRDQNQIALMISIDSQYVLFISWI